MTAEQAAYRLPLVRGHIENLRCIINDETADYGTRAEASLLLAAAERDLAETEAAIKKETP